MLFNFVVVVLLLFMCSNHIIKIIPSFSICYRIKFKGPSTRIPKDWLQPHIWVLPLLYSSSCQLQKVGYSLLLIICDLSDNFHPIFYTHGLLLLLQDSDHISLSLWNVHGVSCYSSIPPISPLSWPSTSIYVLVCTSLAALIML